MPQPVVAQFWDGTAWVDLLMYSDSGATITRGTDGESGLRPSKVELTLNNDDGRYRTSDPMSPLYGLAGRNTRMRIRMNGVTRTQAEAAAWRPSRTLEHKPGLKFGKAWCDLQAEGILRRISQWTTPLQSALRRAIVQYSNSAGYWPFEDQDKATLVSNVVAGGQSAIRRDGDPAGIEGPPGSDRLLKIDATTSVVGTFKPIPVVGGWQVSFSVKVATMPASATFLPLFQWWTANGYRWTLEINNASYRWIIINRDGALVTTFSPGFGVGAEPTKWIVHRVKVFQSGGNTQIEPAWFPEDSSVIYGVTASYVGLTSAPTRWRLSGNTHTVDAGFGHLYAVRGITDDLLSAQLVRAFIGYTGELAANRFFRLLDEEGISRFLTGVAADTAPMGPQRPLTLMNLLKEIIATEDAVIVDRWDDIGLHMFARRVLYNQPVAMALTFPDHVAPGIEEVTDDLGIANVVTAKNSGGAEYTVALESGPVSTLPPPAGIGEAKATYDVNVADETLQLQQTAEWYLGKSTIDRARYPKVRVDLLAHPELTALVEGVDITDRITITGLEREVVDLIVIGMVDRIGHTTRVVEFTCLPADVQHHIGVYDAVTSRYDSASTTLAEDIAIGETAWDLTTVERADCWSTTETPYVAMVGGERVTVTAMTAPAGAGPYTQTATVVRTLAKAHAVGAPFRLADPVYAGL